MKQFLLRLYKENFSYSAKERKGMLVLAGILFCLWGVRASLPYFFPHQPVRITQEEYQTLNLMRSEEVNKASFKTRTSSYFPFDPNTIDSVRILQLGFSPKQAKSWINYRHSGGVFTSKDDLKKLYVVDEEKYKELAQWVVIREEKKIEAEVKVEVEKKTYRIDINTIDSMGLIAIPGIGSYTAAKVIQYRNWLGGFIDSSQFREIKGLRELQIERLKEIAHIDVSGLRYIQINTSNREQLQSHPYIRYKAKILIAYREQHGAYENPSDLLKTGVIDSLTLRKLEGYLQY